MLKVNKVLVTFSILCDAHKNGGDDLGSFNIRDVVNRIEMCVAKAGMSKEEFYEKSGISSASFSQWNTGTHKPSTKKLAAAAATLGVSLEYLMGETEKTPTVSGEGELDENLVQLLTQLTPEGRARVEKFAKFLKSEEAAASAHK